MNRMRSPEHRGLPLAFLVMTAGCSENSLSGQDQQAEDPLVVEEHFQQDALPKADILWVIDNTSSMAEEQAVLSDAFGAFADALEPLDLAWQIGVVSTDISDTDDGGRLLGDPWILTPDITDLSSALIANATVGTSGSQPQAGLGAAWMALSEPLRSTDNRAFRREDAALHVVVVSDGDDGSEAVLGDDPAGAFLDFLADERAETGQAASLSAVVGDLPNGCSWEGGAALPGTRYTEVAEATGGVVASICAGDLTGVATTLGDASATWPDTFPLQAVPDPDTVRVEIDDVRQDSGWTLDLVAPALVFDTAPTPGAAIAVRYEVANP